NYVYDRKPAVNLYNYMKKGIMIVVDIRIQTRTIEVQDGRTVFVTEVVADNVQFLEPKSTTQNRSGQDSFASGFQPNQNQDQMNPTRKEANQFETDGEPIDISDDDLPI